ncbi:MAG TPA: DUF6689 family protein [Thermoanaerobaculia bacterium]
MKADHSWSNVQQSRRRAAAVGTAALVWGLAALAPAPVRAQDGVTEVEVGCDDSGERCRALAARIVLPAGRVGQLRLSFADASSLSADSLEISAEIVDPRDLRSRLPAGTYVPPAFPVLVKIEPAQGARLSFRRHWTLELVTPNLDFSSHTPYRLFRAPDGDSDFEDISLGLGSGSFRAFGAGAAFSEFVIAADLRPVERVVGGKLARLQARLAEAESAIGSGAFDDLDELLDDTLAALQSGAVGQAVGLLDAFVDRVESASGNDVPDDTVPGDGVVGVAAQLLSTALTLRHTLVLGLQSAQGGMSGFSKRLQVGPHTVDLVFEFEDAFVVDVDDLEIEGEIVDVNASGLRARLPQGVQVPAGFPVLIRVNPLAGRDQAFGGAFAIEVRTDSLDFLGGTPLRLFKAPDGGAFRDITRTYGFGSFRVGGAAASFSEFVIAEDRRPIAGVVAEKFQSVGDTIDASAGDVPAAVRGQLKAALSQVRQDVEEGRPDDALAGLESLVGSIEEAAGDSIPSLWRSGESLVNVAGELVSLLETLKFSLELQEAPTVGSPGDVNQDGKVDVGDVFFLIDQVFGDAPPPGILSPPASDEQR